MTRTIITETFRGLVIAVCLSLVFVTLFSIHIGVLER